MPRQIAKNYQKNIQAGTRNDSIKVHSEGV